MKHLVFSLVTFVAVILSACSSPNPQALLDKIEKDPESLTQKDYSAMMDYLDNIVSDQKKFETEMNDDKKSEVLIIIESELDEAMAKGVLNTKNKKRYEALEKKAEKVLDKLLEKTFSNLSDIDDEEGKQTADFDELTQGFDEVFECVRSDGESFLFAIQPETGSGYYLSPGGELYNLTITEENPTRTKFNISVTQKDDTPTKMKFNVKISDDGQEIEGTWTGVDGTHEMEFIGAAR